VCGGSLVEAKMANPKSILASRASLPFMPVEFFCAEIAPRQEIKPGAPLHLTIHPTKIAPGGLTQPKVALRGLGKSPRATNVIALQEPKTHAGQGLRVRKLQGGDNSKTGQPNGKNISGNRRISEDLFSLSFSFGHFFSRACAEFTYENRQRLESNFRLAARFQPKFAALITIKWPLG
jgi:hypothetical protein